MEYDILNIKQAKFKEFFFNYKIIRWALYDKEEKNMFNKFLIKNNF